MWKKQTGTKHNEKCTMSFGNYSAIEMCPRCDELRAGAKPRSWNVQKRESYYDGGLSRTCTNPSTPSHQLNPGGYCIHCGAGRDFS